MKVDKNIPIPPKPKRPGRPAHYPFATMQAGESFFVPKSRAMPEPINSLKSSVSIANKKFAPKHFEIRKIDDGARIFRVA